MKRIGWTAVPQPSVTDLVVEETAFELSERLENDLYNGAGHNTLQKTVGDFCVIVTNSGGTIRVDVWRQVKCGQIDTVVSRQEDI